MLELNTENKRALFLSKAIYNNFKDNKKKDSKNEFNENETKLVRLLEKTVVLDKAE